MKITQGIWNKASFWRTYDVQIILGFIVIATLMLRLSITDQLLRKIQCNS